MNKDRRCRSRKFAFSFFKELTLLELGRIIYCTPFLPPNRDLTHLLDYQERQQVQTPAGTANYQTPPRTRASVSHLGRGS